MSASVLMPKTLCSHFANALRRSLVAACLVAGVAEADEVSLADCPEPVRETILAHLGTGRIEKIKRVAIGDRSLYLVEIDLKGFREIKLQVRGDGTLQKSVEEIRPNELPEAVRAAVAAFLVGRARIDDVERVVADGVTTYHVEIKRPRQPDLDLVFDEEGALVSQK